MSKRNYRRRLVRQEHRKRGLRLVMFPLRSAQWATYDYGTETVVAGGIEDIMPVAKAITLLQRHSIETKLPTKAKDVLYVYLPQQLAQATSLHFKRVPERFLWLVWMLHNNWGDKECEAFRAMIALAENKSATCTQIWESLGFQCSGL